MRLTAKSISLSAANFMIDPGKRGWGRMRGWNWS